MSNTVKETKGTKGAKGAKTNTNVSANTVDRLINVGLIGCGNAGSQVVDLACNTQGFEGLIINSSDRDMDNVTNENIVQCGLGDGIGTNKDRDTTKLYIQQMLLNVINGNEFKDFVEHRQVIFIITSTAGGTGSGLSPTLTNILSKLYPSIRFVLIHILPTMDESMDALLNTLEFIQEMTKIEDLTYMSYTNDKMDTGAETNNLLEVNKNIVQDLTVLRGDYIGLEAKGNAIDEAELLGLIEQPGRLIVNKVMDISENNTEDIQDLLISNLNNDYSTDLELNGVISRVGLIQNLSLNLAQVFDSSITKFREKVGITAQLRKHISSNTENNNNVIAISSGLYLPATVIAQIRKRVKLIKEQQDRIDVIRNSSVDIMDGIDIVKNNKNKNDAIKVAEDNLASLIL